MFRESMWDFNAFTDLPKSMEIDMLPSSDGGEMLEDGLTESREEIEFISKSF
jgi:hypothetical protein